MLRLMRVLLCAQGGEGGKGGKRNKPPTEQHRLFDPDVGGGGGRDKWLVIFLPLLHSKVGEREGGGGEESQISAPFLSLTFLRKRGTAAALSFTPFFIL